MVWSAVRAISPMAGKCQFEGQRTLGSENAQSRDLWTQTEGPLMRLQDYRL